MAIKIRDLTIHLNLDEWGPEHPEHDEFPGSGSFTFPVDFVREHIHAVPEYSDFRTEFESIVEEQKNDRENEPGEDWGDDNYDWPECSNPDDMIALVSAATYDDDGEVSIGWSGPVAFWVYHDLAHVLHGIEEINGEAEDLAHYDGTRFALSEGYPVGDCLRAIVKAESEFKDRFGYPSEAIETICKDLQGSVTLP